MIHVLLKASQQTHVMYPPALACGANKVPALSTDLRLFKRQDWVNSGCQANVFDHRRAATGAAAFKCLVKIWKALGQG